MTYSPMYSRQRADFVAATEAAVQPLVDSAAAWAEGTLPGGAGTKSAKEHAEDAETAAVGVRFGLGNIVGTSAFSWLTTYTGAGAQAFGTAGLKVVSGQTGGTTFLSQQWNLDGASMTGRRVRMVLGYTQSATFTRSVGAMALQVRLTNNSVVTRTTASGTTIAVSVVGNRRVYTIEYDMQGDEAGLRPVVGVSGVSPTATDETISLIDFNCYYLTAVSDAATAGDETLTARLAGVSAASTAETTAQVNANRFGLGNIVGGPDFSFLPQYNNGGVLFGTTGIRVPAGSTGQNTVLQQRWIINGAANTGRSVRMVLGFTQSATFTRAVGAMYLQARLTNNTTANRTATITTTLIGSRRVYAIEYTMQGDETDLRPFIALGAAAAAASDETLTLTDFQTYYLTGKSDASTAADETLALALVTPERLAAAYALGLSKLPSLVPKNVRTIAPSGGDYTTFTAALAAITDATITNRYQVRVRAGTYQEAEWRDKDYVDFIGADRDLTIIDFQQANGTSEANINLYSAFYQARTSRIENLTVRAKNCRYGIHLESDNAAANRVQEIINCRVEHLGNDDAPANTWQTQSAVGSGLSSGQAVIVRSSYFYAKNNGAFFYHTNAGWTNPSFVDCENNVFVTDKANGVGFGFAFMAQALGSRQRDRCRLVGNVFGGDVLQTCQPWLAAPLADQPANHAEIDMYGHGNSPAVFIMSDFGKALMIQSATTGTSSSVAISGTAVKAIFGDGTSDKYYTRPGSVGFAGQVYGWGDISGVAVGPSQNLLITALGKRLGDCTSVNKVLTVTVDGGSPITITFDQDYTAQSNATIIAAINSALGAAATASEFQPGRRYRPRFTDEEFAPKNTSGSGILMGTVCAFDTDDRSIRPMTSADAASRFAGVAWEDIPAGTRGRVKNRGYLPIGDVLRTDSASFAFGDTFSVDASAPGKIVKGGSQGLLMAIRSDAVKVG